MCRRITVWSVVSCLNFAGSLLRRIQSMAVSLWLFLSLKRRLGCFPYHCHQRVGDGDRANVALCIIASTNTLSMIDAPCLVQRGNVNLRFSMIPGPICYSVIAQKGKAVHEPWLCSTSDSRLRLHPSPSSTPARIVQNVESYGSNTNLPDVF